MPPITFSTLPVLPILGRVRAWQALAALAGMAVAAVFLVQVAFAADVGASITFRIQGQSAPYDASTGTIGQEATSAAPFVVEFERGTNGQNLVTSRVEVTFPSGFSVADVEPSDVRFERFTGGAWETQSTGGQVGVDAGLRRVNIQFILNFNATAGEQQRVTFTGGVKLPTTATLGQDDFDFSVLAGQIQTDTGTNTIPLTIIDPAAPASFQVEVSDGGPVVAGQFFEVEVTGYTFT